MGSADNAYFRATRVLESAFSPASQLNLSQVALRPVLCETPLEEPNLASILRHQQKVEACRYVDLGWACEGSRSINRWLQYLNVSPL